jgi:hypothetical protein
MKKYFVPMNDADFFVSKIAYAGKGQLTHGESVRHG